MMSSSGCPLCDSQSVQFFYRDNRRDYFRCQQCDLIFVPVEFHLSSTDEKAQYDYHQNDPQDAGYREFLNRLAQPLIARLPRPSSGLDFGCGPGPTLHLLLEQAGHNCALYDKFYAPDQSLLQNTYDFITATEVVEHLREPRQHLERLWDCLKPQGLLALMTKRATTAEAFAQWHYKNDPTHIIFFSEKTFEWLAKVWGAKCDFYGKDVVIFEKNEPQAASRKPQAISHKPKTAVGKFEQKDSGVEGNCRTGKDAFSS